MSTQPEPLAPPIATRPRLTATHVQVALGALLASMAWACTLTGFSFYTAPVLNEFHAWPISVFTIYFTIYGVVSALSMPLGAVLLQRIGARWLLAIGGAIAAMGLVIFSGATSLVQFYLAGAVAGFGVGLSVQYVPVVLVHRWFEHRRGLVLGIVLAGSGIGSMALSYFIPGTILSLGWRTTMLVQAGILATLTIIPAIFLVRTSPPERGLTAYGAGSETASQPQQPTPAPGLKLTSALGMPMFYVLFASILLMGIMHAMNQHLAAFISADPHGTGHVTAQIATVMMTAALCILVYKPILGALVDRWGLTATMLVALGIAAVAVVGSALTNSAGIYLLCVVGFALGFAGGTVFPPLVAQRAFGPRNFSALWGAVGMAYPLGQAIGTPLWGLVYDRLGSYTPGFLSVPVATALVLAGLLWAMAQSRRTWSAPGG